MNFSIILAVDDRNWLGRNNNLAWRLKADMQYFKETTIMTENPAKINAVIMGRKTWESIPKKFRPLDGRFNFVLTRNKNYSDEWCMTWWSLDEILDIISSNPTLENIFIIWGSHLYNQVLSSNMLDKIYLTHIKWDYNCDVFFDGVPNNFELFTESEKLEENNIIFQFKVFKRK